MRQMNKWRRHNHRSSVIYFLSKFDGIKFRKLLGYDSNLCATGLLRALTIEIDDDNISPEPLRIELMRQIEMGTTYKNKHS